MITATDFFCGMGGSSTGLVEAGLEVKLAANHWARAIETHSANHPDTEHLCADLQAVDLRYMPRTDVLWASPICTEVSPAGGRRKKGAQLDLFEDHGHVPTSAFERTRVTFWEVIRACEIHRYKVVFIENVVEAADWELFDVWLAGMAALGYEVQLISVSAAHIGDGDNARAPQWRDRIYMSFTLRGIPMPTIEPRPLAYCGKCDALVNAVQWWKPKRKHAARKIGKYGAQYLYVCPVGDHGVVEPFVAPASDAIDWTDPGTRIGDRTKPLAGATMRRIRHGLDMMLTRDAYGPVVAAAGNTYDAASRNEAGYVRAWPADGAPTPTQTTTGQFGLVTMLRNHGGTTTTGVPLATFTGGGYHHGLIVKSYGGQLADRNAIATTQRPMPVLRTTTTDFLVIPYRKGAKPHGTDRPLSAMTTHESHGVLSPDVDINDCHFRMLKPRESANAQRFPGDYVIHGNGGEQQMQAGNAVAVNVAHWLGSYATAALGGAA